VLPGPWPRFPLEPEKGRNVAPGSVLKPGKSLFLEAADPLADQVTRGVPPSGRLGDAPASKVGLHQLHPCLLWVDGNVLTAKLMNDPVSGESHAA
jgi:hypothetical protein